MKRLCLSCVLFSGLLLCPLAFASGIVNGTVSLTMPDGQVCPAGYIRVLLVRSMIPVSSLTGLKAMNPHQQKEAIRDLHMKFFIAVREKMSDPAYVVQSALTTSEGVFQFTGAPAGSYYIVVTFPAMVRDRKVAWQIPVTVDDDQTIRVDLNGQNLLMPTYSRN